MSLSEVAKRSSSVELPKKDQKKLVQRKRKASTLAQVGGVIGLSALAARSPQALKLATSHSPTLRVKEPVRRVLAFEPKATGASNALTTVGAGLGATGAFNFAGIQRAEAKADEKRIKKDGGPKQKIAGDVTVATSAAGLSANAGVRSKLNRDMRSTAARVNSIDQYMYGGRSDGARLRMLGGGSKKWVGSEALTERMEQLSRSSSRALGANRRAVGAARKSRAVKRVLIPVGLTGAAVSAHSRRSQVKKGDDRFLREHRQRISPDAERGYNYLRSGRNTARGLAAVEAGVGVGNAAMAGANLASGRKVAAGTNLAVSGAMGVLATRDAKKQKRWNSKMGKIKARAHQRADDGEWGRGRRREVLVDKAMALSKPVKPGFATRAGGIVRTGNKVVTRRGAIAGTGRKLR